MTLQSSYRGHAELWGGGAGPEGATGGDEAEESKRNETKVSGWGKLLLGDAAMEQHTEKVFCLSVSPRTDRSDDGVRESKPRQSDSAFLLCSHQVLAGVYTHSSQRYSVTFCQRLDAIPASLLYMLLP